MHSATALQGKAPKIRMQGHAMASTPVYRGAMGAFGSGPRHPRFRVVPRAASPAIGMIKLALPAGKATPAPPVGPALGQKQVNIMQFCKEYNAATADKAGMIIPVEITVYKDKSFTFVLKTPPTATLLVKAAGIAKGSSTPNAPPVGRITEEQLREIAATKLPDLNCRTIEAAMKTVEGTARNMGIAIDR